MNDSFTLPTTRHAHTVRLGPGCRQQQCSITQRPRLHDPSTSREKHGQSMHLICICALLHTSHESRRRSRSSLMEEGTTCKHRRGANALRQHADAVNRSCLLLAVALTLPACNTISILDAHYSILRTDGRGPCHIHHVPALASTDVRYGKLETFHWEELTSRRTLHWPQASLVEPSMSWP